MTPYENEIQWDLVEQIEYYGFTIEVTTCMDMLFAVSVLNNDGSINQSLTPVINEDESKEALIEKCKQAILQRL